MQLLEYYKWQIVLENETIIDQSESGEKEMFKFNKDNKDFSKIKSFTLVPQVKGLNKIVINLPENSRLIYFRRTIANTGDLFPKFQINMVGWQTTIKNSNFKYIMYIFPDGTTEVSGDDEPKYTDEFVSSLPHRNASDIPGCTGCKPSLERKQ
jgi:hypothetical protein